MKIGSRKLAVITALLLAGAFVSTVPAEWYEVVDVKAWNRVVLKRQDADASPVTVRIGNLRSDRFDSDGEKVFLTGKDPNRFTAAALKGELVWAEHFRVDDGEKVADLYFSYEQAMETFTQFHVTATNAVSPSVRNTARDVMMRMLQQIVVRRVDEDEFQKTFFTYEALNWFKNTGQYQPPKVQEVFVDLIKSYQNAAPQDQKELKAKIQHLMDNYELYRDFLMPDG
ncbi:hypothetical protein [Kiritimatiella glycovorans]|uniref:DUF4369 domain-containing protein n=1 Tax=Kiritimatiella glycovorans TaxID=1307763 RepID=A0A0G3EMQ6_9BACT|nr:hypothetical protein [Kiritimatiella glycovorans]AKJ65389.1 hypothetical protein L21SP4_02161 [Kiritimatiella glycovorans]